MLHHPAAVRAAFHDASDSLLDALRPVRPEQWDRPGALGEWTTRELAAHALRAYVTVDGYLTAAPSTDRILADAGEYYATVLSEPSAHQGVLARARQAGRQLIDPVGEAESTIAHVLAVVASAADDDPVNTFAGQISLVEYLATRVVEVGVHTLDLQRATGAPAELPPSVTEVVLQVLVQLASPVPLILALSGRHALPSGFNVLG